MKNHSDQWMFLGASGRVGRLVTSHWAQNEPPVPLVYQTRNQQSDVKPALLWSPLDGPGPLQDYIKHAGPLQGMLVFVGATPDQSADLTFNRLLAEACLAAALDADIPRVLLASSSAVYGVGQGTPLRETDSLQPVNAYGVAKAEMEDACDIWRRRGLDICCLRIGNVAGADALLKHINNPAQRHIDQYPNGLGPRRSYIGPATLGRVLMSLATSLVPLPPCLNVGAPTAVRMADLATAAKMSWDYVPAPHDHRFQDITLDCQQLQHFHSFTNDDMDSAAIVRQLQDLLN